MFVIISPSAELFKAKLQSLGWSCGLGAGFGKAASREMHLAEKCLRNQSKHKRIFNKKRYKGMNWVGFPSLLLMVVVRWQLLRDAHSTYTCKVTSCLSCIRYALCVLPGNDWKCLMPSQKRHVWNRTQNPEMQKLLQVVCSIPQRIQMQSAASVILFMCGYIFVYILDIFQHKKYSGCFCFGNLEWAGLTLDCMWDNMWLFGEGFPCSVHWMESQQWHCICCSIMYLGETENAPKSRY